MLVKFYLTSNRSDPLRRYIILNVKHDLRAYLVFTKFLHKMVQKEKE